jgi:predicted N-formylglutamate amidohydrolase
LIGPDDPPPCSVVNEGGAASVVVCCDHASAAVPRSLGTLGLDASELDRHIAYDIGAAQVAVRLAARLDAPAVLAGYSRLVIDCNRTLDDHTSVRIISDGTVVPGNRHLAPEEIEARAEVFFRPYHRAIAEQVGRRRANGLVPVVLSVHSYTGEMNGIARPWQLGVLSGDDRRIADPLLAALAADPALCVGDNKPYSGRDLYGYTIETHALPAGLPNVLLEFRQDQVDSETKAHAWADRVADTLQPILRDPFLVGSFAGSASDGGD